MGEKQTKPFQLSFNGLLKVDFQGSPSKPSSAVHRDSLPTQ